MAKAFRYSIVGELNKCCPFARRNERPTAAVASGGPVAKLALHPQLAALSARNMSDTQRTQYFEQLYSNAVRQRVEALLSDDNFLTLTSLKEMIKSLVERRVRVVKGDGIVEWCLSGDEFMSLSAQLSQQCALRTVDDWTVSGVCNALCEGRTVSDYSREAVLVAAVRAERLQDALPLLAALFERAEYVRHVSEHLFVVPLLIGRSSQFDAVTQPFRDFCLSLNNG